MAIERGISIDRSPNGLGTFLWAVVALGWVAAFMPEPYAVATLLGMFGLLRVIERCERFRHLVFLIALFGALGIGFGYRWLAPTIEQFSNGRVGRAGSWSAVAAFGIAGTLHILVFALIYRLLLRRPRRPHPLVVVALFVAVESLPIRLFPWMAGYGAADVPALMQSASWGGVPGVSFALLALVVPVHEVWVGIVGADPRRARVGGAAATFLIGAVLFAWGHLRWQSLRESDDLATHHLHVGIVQPNIGSGDKRGAEERRTDKKAETIAAFHRGSRAVIDRGARLVVWPETAITDPIALLDPKFDARVTRNTLARYGWDFVDELGKEAAFLVGAYERKVARDAETPRGGVTGPAVTVLESRDDRYNVAALRPQGDGRGAWSVYRKSYLIPFGETMPLGLSDEMLPQRFRMWPAPKPSSALAWDDLRIVPFLCYEGLLADHVRTTADGKAPHLLVSLTNDSWFGDTWEPHQHLNFTRFRAVEHAVPLVRATNTGVSAFVTASGDVVERLGVGVEGTLVRPVPIVERGPTIYARFGHHLPAALAAFVLLAMLFGAFGSGDPVRRRD